MRTSKHNPMPKNNRVTLAKINGQWSVVLRTGYSVQRNQFTSLRHALNWIDVLT